MKRTQPLLPMGLGYAEGVTHDHVRHGTTTLPAALNVANGEVTSRVREQHRQQEFQDVLRQIDKQPLQRAGSGNITTPAPRRSNGRRLSIQSRKASKASQNVFPRQDTLDRWKVAGASPLPTQAPAWRPSPE